MEERPLFNIQETTASSDLTWWQAEAQAWEPGPEDWSAGPLGDSQAPGLYRCGLAGSLKSHRTVQGSWTVGGSSLSCPWHPGLGDFKTLRCRVCRRCGSTHPASYSVHLYPRPQLGRLLEISWQCLGASRTKGRQGAEPRKSHSSCH